MMGRRLADGRQWGESILIGLLATAAAGPLIFYSGFLNTRGGGDSPFLLFRLHQLVTALADGHFPVRWMPDAAFGLGYPFFNYYAPLPYYVGAVFHFWGLGLIAAVKLTQWLGFLLGAWAMAKLVLALTRDPEGQGNPWAAGLAAVAYTFAPYHLVNVYVRGDSLSEFWAMGLYPLILWLAWRLWEQPGRARLSSLALSYGALVLTHNISALIFSPLLLLFLVLLVWREGWQKVSWLAGALLLGVALSAFYWLPALGEQGAVQLNEQTSGYFNYSNHFRTLSFGGTRQDLIQSSSLFDFEIADRTPFSMGLVQALLSLAGLVAALISFRRRNSGDATGRHLLPLFGALTFLIATLMITPASRILWERVPLLPLVQFPWRFLSIQALGTAILAASLFPSPGPHSLSRTPRSGVLIALSLLIAVSSLASLQPDRIVLASADVSAENLQLYEWFSGNLGTTIRYEYLPEAVVPRLYSSDKIITGQEMKVQVLAGEAIATLLEKQTGRESWLVKVDSGPATISFPTLYWPGWRAREDGDRVAVRPADSTGTITLDLPAGEHQVDLSLGRTPLRLAAELVSLGALGLALSFLLRDSHYRPGSWRRWLLLGLAVILIGFVLRLLPKPTPYAGDLTWDFAQAAYLHHNPEGVAFGEAAMMQDYTITAQEDDTWQLLLHWSEVRDADLEVELALVSPAVAQGRASHSLVSESQSLAAGQSTSAFSLHLPASTPPGPLLPQLRMFQGGEEIMALTSAGRTRGTLFLKPVWLPGQSPDSAQRGPLQLQNVQADALDPKSLAVTLDWAMGDPLPANYKLALRLRDADGEEWAALDAQPGYGYYPSSTWQAGTYFSDRLVLTVPYGLPPGDYSLSVLLYDAATLVPAWGPEDRPVSVEAVAPYDGRPLLHRFSSSVAVAGITAMESIQQGDPLSFTVTWVGLEAIEGPTPFHWELINMGGRVAASGVGEVMVKSGHLLLARQSARSDPSASAGDYSLRLALDDSAIWEAAMVTIKERARLFDLPDMDIPLSTDFGPIRLEGADLAQEAEQIHLTLYWRAQESMTQNYTVFVHLFEPGSEAIPVQHDAMFRGNSYPSSGWAADEVVEDSITLSLADVPSGRYRLGVGLYWQEGDRYPRLPATDAEGGTIPDGRLVLPIEITVP